MSEECKQALLRNSVQSPGMETAVEKGSGMRKRLAFNQ
jgi:hypothetical protein